MQNYNSYPIRIMAGKRIAQLTVEKLTRCEVMVERGGVAVIADQVEPQRRTGGFGSTG